MKFNASKTKNYDSLQVTNNYSPGQRSVAVLNMLFDIMSNPMHPLSGELTLPYVTARYSEHNCVVDNRPCLYLIAVELCTAGPLHPPPHISVSLRDDLNDPVSDGVGLAGPNSRANVFLMV